MLPSVGEQVSVHQSPCSVRYVGPTHFADGTWIGVEFTTSCGRNDGSVEGTRYFECRPRCGLFVRAQQVLPASEAAARIERDVPEEHVRAWATMENVLEAEAIQAGLDGDRVLQHLQSLHPKEGDESEPATPGRRARGEGGKKKRPMGALAKQEVTASSGGADIATRLHARYDALPADYAGPTLEGGPSAAGMAQLLWHIKSHIAKGAKTAVPGQPETPAVPGKMVVDILTGAIAHLEANAGSLVELPLTEGRVVLVGDTHGQLDDFCWILKAHGPPARGNIYLINGDVADRGGYAVEIYLLIFGYMLACPGCVYLDRGNHESFDMNIRGFGEGGGFASEVGAKYDAEMFALFQTLFNLLPLATRINNEVLVVHGGLCRTGTATLEQMRAVDRKRPVPVSTTDPRDLLFFDTMWADPQEQPGISRSVARGSVCVTFGPDITRRFCEINRLRMIIRSHEVPRSMSGVAVQHEGRLITVFSASNYCGRIGNTGGTMLLTPSLDYQLMEHWSPSLDELVRIEEEEEAARRAGAEPATPPGPVQLRRQHSADAELMMQSDVLEKLKDLICAHSSELRRHFDEVDVAKSGRVSVGDWAAGMRAVVRGGMALPWEDYVAHLATREADQTISYKAFLNRYRFTGGGGTAGWQSRLLSSMYAQLSKLNLTDTVAMLDQNRDGMVSFDELHTVMSTFAMGLPEEAVTALTRQLLRGEKALRTADLLDMINVTYKEEAKDGLPPRMPPAWAAPLLEAVSKQCAMRQADSIDSFKAFDTDGDGYISVPEFQTAMLALSGHDDANATQEQRERVTSMLRDLAAWVDRDGDGKINYLEFISAFRIGSRGGTADAPSAAPAATPEPDATEAIDMLLEHLCSLFYRHRWSLKHAFEVRACQLATPADQRRPVDLTLLRLARLLYLPRSISTPTRTACSRPKSFRLRSPPSPRYRSTRARVAPPCHSTLFVSLRSRQRRSSHRLIATRTASSTTRSSSSRCRHATP